MRLAVAPPVTTLCAAGLLLGVFALVAWPSSAAATNPRFRLERIDPTDYAIQRTMRFYASMVHLEGSVDETRPASEYRLRIDGEDVAEAQEAKPFGETGEEIYIALLIEHTPAFRKAMPEVIRGAQLFVRGLGPQARITFISYTDEINRQTNLTPPEVVSGKLATLEPSGSSANPRLIESLTQGLKVLLGVQPKPGSLAAPRRILVVLSDGINPPMDRDLFRAVGAEARIRGIPIHAIAFSPQDFRVPLLNLGEIAKQSQGTLRWAQQADDIPVQFKTLLDEVRRQAVLTFRFKADKLTRRQFQVATGQRTSNPLYLDPRLVPQLASLIAASEKHFPWSLLVSALAVVSLGGLGATIWVLRRRAAANAPLPKWASRMTGIRTVPPRPAAQTGRTPAAQAQPAPPGWPAAAGQARRGAATGAPAAPAVLPASARGILVFISGARAGGRVQLADGVTTIGKGPGNNLVITDDPFMSTAHAEICRERAGFRLIDRGSTNGTFVNDQRIMEQPLRENDIVKLGQTLVKFKIE